MSLSQLCARICCRHAGTVACDRRVSPRGQSLVEFALALPLFLVLVFGILDFGRMMAIHAALVTASREGARYAAAIGDSPSTPGTPRYLDCAGIREHVRDAAGPLVTLADGQIEITYERPPDPDLVACPPAASPGQIDSLDRVVVKVTATYEAITPLVRAAIGPVDVVSTDRRTIVKAGP